MDKFTITVADNGYILENNNEDSPYLIVYESNERTIPHEMYKDLMAELKFEIFRGEAPKYMVSIDVKPLDDDNNNVK